VLTADAPSRIDLPDESAIVVRELGDVTLISLVGEHDVSTADDVRVALGRPALDGKGVALSLEHVTFMDSAIVRTLCVADRRLLAQGRRLAVFAAAEGIAARVVELCRLQEALLFGDTLEETIRFAGRPNGRLPAG